MANTAKGSRRIKNPFRGEFTTAGVDPGKRFAVKTSTTIVYAAKNKQPLPLKPIIMKVITHIQCLCFNYLLCLVISNAALAQNFTFEKAIGNFEGYLQSPNVTVVSRDNGNVYVTSSGNHTVQVFNRSGDFLFNFGDQGSGDGQFQYPIGITLDNAGNVYVVDHGNNRIQVFDHEGNFLRKFGKEGTGDGEFHGPGSITTDGTDNSDVYVTDRYNQRVQVFSQAGEFLFKFGSKGTNDGEFINPSHIAANEDIIYVLEAGRKRIQLFEKNGAFVGKFVSEGAGDGFQSPSAIAYDHNNGLVYVTDHTSGHINVFSFFGDFIKSLQGKPEQFRYAHGIAVDGNAGGARILVTSIGNSAAVINSTTGALIHKLGTHGTGDGQFNYLQGGITTDAASNVYITDVNNHRIQIFNSEGDFVRKIGSLGTGDGQFDFPKDVAVDGAGNIYVADAGNSRVQVFTPEGVHLQTIGHSGDGDGEFNGLRDLTVDAMGNLYTVEEENHRIQVFSHAGIFLRKFGSFGEGDGKFNAPADIAVDPNGAIYVADYGNHRIQVFDNAGNFKRTIGTTGEGVQYPNSIAFDGSENIYVTEDTGNGKLKIFSNAGNYLGVFQQNTEDYLSTALDKKGNVYITQGYKVNVYKKQLNNIVDFSDISKTFTDPPFALTATSSSTGVITYREVMDPNNTGEIYIDGNNITLLKAGTVKIKASVPDDHNYSSAEKEVTLTIGKGSQAIHRHEAITKVLNDPPFYLAAEASSGLPLMYVSTNPDVATIIGNRVTLHGPGETTIIASQEGDNDYLPAQPVERALVVNIVAGVEVSPDVSVDVYPNPASEHILVKTMGAIQIAPALVDVSGKVQQAKGHLTDMFTYQFDVSQLQPGIYLVNVKHNNRVITKKIIKK